MALPNSGTFSYNGISFVSLYKSKVEVKPVKDSAGRALVAREYSIDVTGRIATPADVSTDTTLAAMRIALEQPAGQLVYIDKGFGPLSVNVPGGVKDAAYGPWPDVLGWEPIGNDQGCLVRWRCTTTVPCEESPSQKGVIEYCWTENWDVDQDGYTTRTIEGHVTIQATRDSVNSRTISDNADAYREQITPDLPLGFRRTESFKLSEDKRTLDFSFTDEQIPQPLPAAVSTAEVRHKVSWRRGEKGTPPRAIASLSGTLTLPAQANKSLLWDQIMLIIASRWPVGALGVQANKDWLYLIDSIDVDDEVFGRGTSFSATALVLGLKAKLFGPLPFLAASNLWAAIPGTNFVQWKQSLFQKSGSGKPFAPRGMAGMRFQNSDDAIVDLCSNEALLTGNSNAPGRSLVGKGQLPRQPNGAAIDPQITWLNYRLRLRLLEDDRMARHKLLGGPTARTPKPVAPPEGTIVSDGYQNSPGLIPPQANELGGFIGAVDDAAEDIGAAGPGFIGGVPDLLQQVSVPTFTVRLEGYATRLAYPIPIPRLATIGQVPVTQLNQDVSQEQISSVGGLPVFAATWSINYALPQAAGALLPMPGNPAVD